MLNEAIHIATIDLFTAHVAWTPSDESWFSWVFVDGELAVGPIPPISGERVAIVDLPSGHTGAIDVHDLPDLLVVPRSIYERPNTTPDLLWRAAPFLADRYRVYHGEDGVADDLVYDEEPQEDQSELRIACPITLEGQGGIWHALRIEAVDSADRETAGDAWNHYAMEPPAPPAIEVAPAGSSAHFNITIGV